MTLLINNEEVASVLSLDDYVRLIEDIVQEYAAGDAVCVPRIDALVARAPEDSVYIWGSMQGGSKREQAYALRIKSDVVYWQQEHGTVTEEKYAGRTGLYCGLVFLFSTDTGEPLAIIHDGHLQHMRVGARVGLSAKYLAREDASTLCIVGSGGMARTNASAVCRVRPINRIQVFSPTPEHLVAYVEEMSRELQVDVIAAASAREAVEGADIVCLCTDSIEPVIEADWIRPGVHVTQMQLAELDFDPSRFFDVIFTLAPTPLPLGHTEPLSHGNIEFAGAEAVSRYPVSRRNWERAPARQSPERRARLVDLAGLMARTELGRTGRDQITYHGANTIGGGTQGLEFVAVAPTIFREARERGLGHEIPTEWFLQDVRN